MLALAKEAAEAAGDILRRPPEAVRYKGVVDLVTAVDLASEEKIREILGRSGIAVQAEEQGGATSGERWVVDPLDGTTNFVHGFPFYCASIALVDASGRVQVGVIHDPVRRETYAAERGRGATVNGQPLRTSPRTELGEALLASGFAYDRRQRAGYYLSFVQAFLERCRCFRRSGSAAMDLAMVARGQLEGFWEFGLKPWDVAAGSLIVEEAGGRVSDMAGGPLDIDRPRILASNGHLHGAMIEVIQPLLEA